MKNEFHLEKSTLLLRNLEEGPARERGRWTVDKYNAPSLWEWQSRLDCPAVVGHQTEKLSIYFVFGVRCGDLGEESATPSDGNEARIARLTGLMEMAFELFEAVIQCCEAGQ